MRTFAARLLKPDEDDYFVLKPKHSGNDAYMRDYKVYVPSDCCASNEKADNDYVLSLMAQILKADTRSSTELDLPAMIAEARK